MRDRDAPNPGSDEAIAAGCRCAVMDNNHGKWAPFPPDGWYITVGCPVHLPSGEVLRDSEQNEHQDQEHDHVDE